MNRISSRLAVVLAMLMIGCSSSFATEPAKPNIVVILADDLGFSDLGCYGGEIATPHLDRLAANGLRFSQFYNTARCWPTRAAILTGYYAQQVRRDRIEGIPSGNGGTRPVWARLLPEHLAPLGYRSYHSGKWHVDGKPLQAGFHRSYSLQDHDRNFTPRNHTEDDKPLPVVTAQDKYYTSTRIAEHAIQCLKDHAAQHAGSPFFTFLAFTSPHFPLQAPPEDIEKYRDLYRAGWDRIRNDRWARIQKLPIPGASLSPVEREIGPPYAFPDAIRKLGADEVNRPIPWADLTPSQQAFQAAKMAIHAAMVDRMDREIGRVLDQIRSMGAWENTLIVFLSDNGASAEMMVRGDGHDPKAAPGSAATFLSLGPGWSTVANTPFRRHKTWLHEGGISTPFIAHWPKGITARGDWRQFPAHCIDLLPTILAAAGSQPLERWQNLPIPPKPGKNLLPVFADNGPKTRDELWWQHEGNRAYREGDWKIVAAGKDAAWELYDLNRDRSETQNLADKQPERVRELAAKWSQRLAEFTKLAKP